MNSPYVRDEAVVADRARGRLWLTLFGVCVVVVAGAALLRSHGESTTTLPPAAAATPSTLSKEATATIPEALAPIYESGWLPYDGDDVLHPEPDGLAKRKGFAHYGVNAAPGKAPIYDAPQGKIVGYAYSQLGFVAVADDARFDAHALRIARFGCDAFQDASCVPAGFQPPSR